MKNNESKNDLINWIINDVKYEDYIKKEYHEIIKKYLLGIANMKFNKEEFYKSGFRIRYPIDKDGNNILMQAMVYKQSSIAKYILDEKIVDFDDLCIKNNIGFTALHFAAYNGFLGIVKKLIGADIPVSINTAPYPHASPSIDNHYFTAVQLALIQFKYEVAKLLIKKGAKVNCKPNLIPLNKKKSLNVSDRFLPLSSYDSELIISIYSHIKNKNEFDDDTMCRMFLLPASEYAVKLAMNKPSMENKLIDTIKEIRSTNSEIISNYYLGHLINEIAGYTTSSMLRKILSFAEKTLGDHHYSMMCYNPTAFIKAIGKNKKIKKNEEIKKIEEIIPVLISHGFDPSSIPKRSLIWPSPLGNQPEYKISAMQYACSDTKRNINYIIQFLKYSPPRIATKLLAQMPVKTINYLKVSEHVKCHMNYLSEFMSFFPEPDSSSKDSERTLLPKEFINNVYTSYQQNSKNPLKPMLDSKKTSSQEMIRKLVHLTSVDKESKVITPSEATLFFISSIVRLINIHPELLLPMSKKVASNDESERLFSLLKKVSAQRNAVNQWASLQRIIDQCNKFTHLKLKEENIDYKIYHNAAIYTIFANLISETRILKQLSFFIPSYLEAKVIEEEATKILNKESSNDKLRLKLFKVRCEAKKVAQKHIRTTFLMGTDRIFGKESTIRKYFGTKDNKPIDPLREMEVVRAIFNYIR